MSIAALCNYINKLAEKNPEEQFWPVLSIPLNPFPVTKGKGKIWRTEPTLETSGLDEENVDKVKRSICVLQRMASLGNSTAC